MLKARFIPGTVVFLAAASAIFYAGAFGADMVRGDFNPYLDIEGFLQRYEAEGEILMVSVNIWGQVVSPGKYKVPDGTDVVSLISYAGGPTEYASLSDVRLSRPSADGGENIAVAVDRYLDAPAAGTVPVLKPGDTVYVYKNRKYSWKAFVEVVAQVAVITSTVLLVYEVTRGK